MKLDPPANRSPEREVLLLAGRPGDDPSVRARLEKLLSDGIDWTVLVRLAKAHRLVALLDARLQPIGAPRVPGDITQALDYWSTRNEDRARRLARAATDVAGASQALGLAALFVQGPALAIREYGSSRLQDAINPGLLLRMSDVDRFHGLLTARRYLLQKPDPAPGASPTSASDASTRIYYRPEDDTVIEVSTTLVPAAAGVSLDENGVRDRAVECLVGDAHLKTLSLEDLVLFLCVSGGARKWGVVGELCDLAWLLHRHPEIDLVQVRARARALSVERSLLLGLALARQVLGLPLDAALTDQHSVRRIVPRVSARLLAVENRPSRRFELSPLQLLLRSRLEDKSRYAANSLLAAWRAGLGRRKRKPEPRSAISARARNKVHWSTRSDAWEKWSAVTRPRSEEMSRALISAAAVRADHCVLDLACGVGDTSLALGPLVGPGGLVVATDLAFEMVTRARQRAIDDGLTNLRYCSAAMENLPFGDCRFDSMVCRLGIMYSPCVQGALAEARRVLRPGARAAFLVCGPQEENPILKVVHEVVSELFELERGDASIDPFRFGAAGSLAQEMAQAGFLDVVEQDLSVLQHAPYGTPFWLPSLERGMSFAFADLPNDTRHELEQRMVSAFEPFARSGFYELPSLSRITRGTCP